MKRVVLDRAGRARGLIYQQNDARTEQEHAAAAVVIAAGAFESTRLLLLSSGPLTSARKNGGRGRRAEETTSAFVTDRFGKVHGTRSLFVVGGSNFASSSTLHPTLTMVALAIRAAGHMIDQVL